MGEKITLGGLLQTEDPDEQVRRVEMLLEAANAPVITMTASVDTRNGKVDLIINGNYSFSEMYEFVDTVRRELLRRERHAVISQAQSPAEPAQEGA